MFQEKVVKKQKHHNAPQIGKWKTTPASDSFQECCRHRGHCHRHHPRQTSTPVTVLQQSYAVQNNKFLIKGGFS